MKINDKFGKRNSDIPIGTHYSTVESVSSHNKFLSKNKISYIEKMQKNVIAK
jgi:hypothetical protein